MLIANRTISSMQLSALVVASIMWAKWWSPLENGWEDIKLISIVKPQPNPSVNTSRWTTDIRAGKMWKSSHSSSAKHPILWVVPPSERQWNASGNSSYLATIHWGLIGKMPSHLGDTIVKITSLVLNFWPMMCLTTSVSWETGIPIGILRLHPCRPFLYTPDIWRCVRITKSTGQHPPTTNIFDWPPGKNSKIQH